MAPPILTADAIDEGGDALGVIAHAAGIDRVEALVIVIVPVELHVHPGVVFGLVEWFEAGGVSMGWP